MPPTPYHLRVRWGPHEAHIDEVLDQTTYFTTKKLDFFSRVGADILVEPSAYISCGSGAPPADSLRIELADVWGPRSHQ
jgi:hypothetical protein